MELTCDQIMALLPHRHPFLLLDRVVDGQAGQWARAVKCVSAGEPWAQGHFPGRALMPGVLILEAIAQAGAVALLSDPRHSGRLAVFGGVKNARFLHPVTPGDRLELECRLTRLRGAVGLAEGLARVGERTVCTAELTFALLDGIK